MISRQLVFGAALAAAALAALPSAASAVAITDVSLGQAAIGGGPVTPTQLAIGNAVTAGDTAAPLPEPVDPGSVLLPGVLWLYLFGIGPHLPQLVSTLNT